MFLPHFLLMNNIPLFIHSFWGRFGLFSTLGEIIRNTAVNICVDVFVSIGENTTCTKINTSVLWHTQCMLFILLCSLSFSKKSWLSCTRVINPPNGSDLTHSLKHCPAEPWQWSPVLPVRQLWLRLYRWSPVPPGSFQLLIFASCSFLATVVKTYLWVLLLTPELLCVAPMKTDEYKIWHMKISSRQFLLLFKKFENLTSYNSLNIFLKSR